MSEAGVRERHCFPVVTEVTEKLQRVEFTKGRKGGLGGGQRMRKRGRNAKKASSETRVKDGGEEGRKARGLTKQDRQGGEGHRGWHLGDESKVGAGSGNLQWSCLMGSSEEDAAVQPAENLRQRWAWCREGGRQGADNNSFSRYMIISSFSTITGFEK